MELLGRQVPLPDGYLSSQIIIIIIWSFETGSHFVAEAGLRLLVILVTAAS